jgi:hypothetical protein
MSNDATQEGVSATAADANQPQQLHPREAAMRNIMASRLQQFSTESGIEVKPSFEAVDPDADPDDAVAEAERARLAAGGDAAGDDDQQALQTAAAAAAAAPAKVKVKVDGVEEEVSLEEMTRTYQKNAAADRRLEEANRRLREADEREAQLNAQMAERSAAATKTNPAEPLVDPATAKQFTAALFDGDEEKAVAGFNAAVQAAVDKAMSGRAASATPVDPEEIAAQVEQRFAVNSALKQSQSDYPDMYADPDIEALAAMKIRAKRTNEGMDFVDALEATQSELAAKFGWKKSGRQDAAAATTRDEKQKRKEALDPVASANVKASSTVAAPVSNSDIIAQMAARRPGYGV